MALLDEASTCPCGKVISLMDRINDDLNQAVYDARIWREIQEELCIEYDIEPGQLDDILTLCYPRYLEDKAMVFLDMPNKLFWREIPKAIRRCLPSFKTRGV